MALYSFGRVKIISRNKVRSAVATAAYHAGIELQNQYDGEVHDYTYKKNVGETYIRMPESVPAAWRDESVPAKERLGLIWNAVEMASPAQNARLARTNFLALQNEFTLEQNLECVDEWIRRNCTALGMGVTYTVHLKEGNPHVDVMYLANEYDANGKVKTKSKKEYFCRNAAGEERYMDAETFRASVGWEKVYKYQQNGVRKDMTKSEATADGGSWERINKHPVCRTVTVGGWDDTNLADAWRKSWAEILNKKFAELGYNIQVDHRSHKERGLAQLPTRHEGWGPGREANQEHNAEVREFNEAIMDLHQVATEEIHGIQNQIEDLRRNEQTLESIADHGRQYRQRKAILDKVAESELLGDKGTAMLERIFEKLHRAFVRLIEQWKGRLRGDKGKTVQDAAQRAQEASQEAQRGVDDILADATARADIDFEPKPLDKNKEDFGK